jgi:hypothetical protein
MKQFSSTPGHYETPFLKSFPRTPQHCFVLGALKTEKELSLKQAENMLLFLHFRALALHTNPKF